MLAHLEGSHKPCEFCSLLGRGPVGADRFRRQCRECDQWTFVTRRTIRASLQFVLKKCYFRVVGFVGFVTFLQCTVSVDSSFTIRLGRPFFLIITRRGFVIPHLTRTTIETSPVPVERLKHNWSLALSCALRRSRSK